MEKTQIAGFTKKLKTPIVAIENSRAYSSCGKGGFNAFSSGSEKYGKGRNDCYLTDRDKSPIFSD